VRGLVADRARALHWQGPDIYADEALGIWNWVPAYRYQVGCSHSHVIRGVSSPSQFLALGTRTYLGISPTYQNSTEKKNVGDERDLFFFTDTSTQVAYARSGLTRRIS
jgi:hypothetical protein